MNSILILNIINSISFLADIYYLLSPNVDLAADYLSYFQEGLAPINLVVETELHRATPGGTGGVKTIGNYAGVLQAQSAAKAKGFSDVLYLDCVHKRYLEEVSSCNVFVVKVNIFVLI